MAQAPLLREAFGRRPHLHSRYTLVGLLGWGDLIHFWWVELSGAVSVFAEQGGGYFMPLPPLDGDGNPNAWRASWEILGALNQGSAVSRIEGLELSDVKTASGLGLTVKKSEPEYLYRREDLVPLKGNRYRSQRWAANRCARVFSPLVRPYQAQDLLACLTLYTRWAIGRHQAVEARYPKALLRDGLFFHRRLLMDAAALGLTGWVVEVGDALAGYTLGGWVAKDTFAVFLEITDRSISGLAAFLFRELCRSTGECRFINAMGDSDLATLAKNKLAYRPCGMVWSGAAS